MFGKLCNLRKNKMITREADAPQQPRKNGLQSENDKIFQVEHLHPFRSEFNDAVPTLFSEDDLSKPCSSSIQAFYVNGRFNYLKKTHITHK